MNVITRFAPSPTGFLHIGGARTALFSYLFARKNGGKFLLRIEDTDRQRSTKEFEKSILEGIAWLGLKYDNTEMYRQSEKGALYKKTIEKLIADGHAFISKETPKEEGDRAEVIRFKNPNKKVKFQDLIRGEIEFDTTDLGDFIIAKSLEEPIFHLTNVVDDIEMGVTHIIRGEDHISNTPRQILIWEAIGAPRSIYAHIPLILASDRSKMSKRHGATSVIDYEKKGYLPEAFVNFLALLGWNPGTDQEIFTLKGLEEAFDISKVQKSGAIFNEEKLKWFNKEYIKALPKEISRKSLKVFLPTDFKYPKNENLFLDVTLERISTLNEVSDLREKGELSYFESAPTEITEKIVWKKDTVEGTKTHLNEAISIFEKIDSSVWNTETAENTIKEALMPYAEKVGKGNVLWPIRYALSGRDQSPDPFRLSAILGKDETLNRIKYALGKL